MPRKLVALMISLLAVAFAFGALTAIRWPSIIMLVGFFYQDSAGEALAGTDWRQLGLIYGAPYFLAALCFYAASAMIAQRRHGAFTWYLMGCAAGFPCVYLVDFHPNWWENPTAGEGAVAGAGVIALLLTAAVWDLRRRKSRPVSAVQPNENAPAYAGDIPDGMVLVHASQLAALAPEPSQHAASQPPRRPPSAAIQRQRAHFAREGQKMLARRAAQRGR